MYFISTSKGFVEALRNLNNRYQLDTTFDPRKALTFATYGEAFSSAKKAELALPYRAQYWAVLKAA